MPHLGEVLIRSRTPSLPPKSLHNKPCSRQRYPLWKPHKDPLGSPGVPALGLHLCRHWSLCLTYRSNIPHLDEGGAASLRHSNFSIPFSKETKGSDPDRSSFFWPFTWLPSATDTNIYRAVAGCLSTPASSIHERTHWIVSPKSQQPTQGSSSEKSSAL